jgi:hypothetical protein
MKVVSEIIREREAKARGEGRDKGARPMAAKISIEKITASGKGTRKPRRFTDIDEFVKAAMSIEEKENADNLWFGLGSVPNSAADRFSGQQASMRMTMTTI